MYYSQKNNKIAHLVIDMTIIELIEELNHPPRITTIQHLKPNLTLTIHIHIVYYKFIQLPYINETLALDFFSEFSEKL